MEERVIKPTLQIASNLPVEFKSQRYRYKLSCMLDVAYKVSTLSTCIGKNVGAVLCSKDFHILSSGYNGVKAGLQHCVQHSNYLEHDHTNEIHAEVNCLEIARSKAELNSLHDNILFVTHTPCYNCTMYILEHLDELKIRYIITREIYENKAHPLSEINKLLREQNISLYILRDMFYEPYN